MNTIAELKKRMTPGKEVDIVNLRYPELSGKRTVLKAQSNRWCLSLPEGHPKAEDHRGSWLDIPKRTNIDFDGDTVVFVHEDDGIAWVRMTVEP